MEYSFEDDSGKPTILLQFEVEVLKDSAWRVLQLGYDSSERGLTTMSHEGTNLRLWFENENARWEFEDTILALKNLVNNTPKS